MEDADGGEEDEQDIREAVKEETVDELMSSTTDRGWSSTLNDPSGVRLGKGFDLSCKLLWQQCGLFRRQLRHARGRADRGYLREVTGREVLPGPRDLYG